MNDTILIIWGVIALLGFAGSALFSGMETGAYSLNRIRLHVMMHHGNHAAVTLHHLLARPTTLLTTLLIGNNITNYLGTAGMGVILESQRLGDWQLVLLNALIVTPILFVVGETLPKDLFAAHSDRLMYPLAPVLTFSRRLFTFTGLIPLISLFSNTLMRALGQDVRVNAFHPRRQVGLLVREGVGYGLLSQEQSAIVDRVLNMSDRTVDEVMTAWQNVDKVRTQDSPAMVRRLAQRTTHTRVPVIDRKGAVVGVLRLNDALSTPGEPEPAITDLATPPQSIAHKTPIRDALTTLQQHAAGMAIVTGHAGQPIGVVTVKDLIEPITGSLTQW